MHVNFHMLWLVVLPLVLIIDPAHKFDNWGVDEIQPYSYGSNFVDNPWEIDSRGF